jgi:hypothetical protein
MKMSKPSIRPKKALRGGGVILAGALIAATSAVAATKGSSPADSPAFAPGARAVQFPEPVAAVLRLLDAKVDPEVIKAFIRNSAVLYHLSAEQIIALKNRGVAPDLIAMLVQQGAGLATPPGLPLVPPYPGSPNLYTPAPYGSYDQDLGPAPGYDYPYATEYPYLYPSDAYGYPYDDYWWYNNFGYPWGWGWGGYWPFYSGYGRFGSRFHNRFFGNRFASGRFGPVPNRSFAMPRSAVAPAASLARRAPLATGFGGRPALGAHSGFGGHPALGGAMRAGGGFGGRGGGRGGGHR